MQIKEEEMYSGEKEEKTSKNETEGINIQNY